MREWITKGNQQIFCIRTLKSNAYVVKKDEKYLLIDTGIRCSFYKIKNKLDELGVNEENLEALILTHTHYDHVGSAHLIKRMYNTQIIVHERESTFIEEGNAPENRGSLFITRLVEKSMQRSLTRMRKYQGVEKDVVVSDYYALKELGFDGIILHTPGHTIGSLSVVLEDEIAIVGDTMFGIIKGSIFPPYAMDVGILLDSWRKLLDTGCDVFLPGHGLMNTKACVEGAYNKFIKKQGGFYAV